MIRRRTGRKSGRRRKRRRALLVRRLPVARIKNLHQGKAVLYRGKIRIATLLAGAVLFVVISLFFFFSQVRVSSEGVGKETGKGEGEREREEAALKFFEVKIGQKVEVTFAR